MRSLIMTLALVLISLGCNKPTQADHPGAISSADSYSYDILLSEQAAIEQAKADLQSGKLPAEAKDPLNKAIAQYNSTLVVWNSYHASGGDASKLQQATSTLVSLVGELMKYKTQTPVPISELTPWVGVDQIGGAYAN